MTYAAEGNRNTAARIISAHENFEASLIEIAGITAVEAKTVTSLYLKHKLAKMDAVGGRISVKHGAYLDSRAILNAVKMAVA